MIYAWEHTDPYLGLKSEQGLAMAETGTAGPIPLEHATDQFRAFMARVLWTATTLTTSIPQAPEGALVIPNFDSTSYRHEWGKQVAQTLLAPFFVYAKLPTSNTSPPRQFKTYQGKPPEPWGGGDVGVLPAAWVLYVAGSAAWTAVCCYTAHEAADIIDRHLSRSADVQKMTSSLAAAVRTVEIHNAREMASGGQPLPLNEAEARVLADLGTATQVLANKQDPSRNGGSGFFAGLGLGGIALGAAALYFVFNRGKTS